METGMMGVPSRKKDAYSIFIFYTSYLPTSEPATQEICFLAPSEKKVSQ